MSALKRKLISWGAGREVASGPGDGGDAVVVLEDATRLPAVLDSDLVGPDSVVLAPADGAPSTDPRVLHHEGSLSEPGADFTVDHDFYLQIQGYAISEYMSIVGPALVRVTDPTDLDTYLSDADRARSEGEFPEFLVHPVVQLADLPALGGGTVGAGPRNRLWVAADGGVSTSPYGRRLGTVDDGLARLDDVWRSVNDGSPAPCAVCLDGAVPDAVRVPAVTDRPWLGRYLAAVDAVRQIRFRGEPVPAVSGFGARLSAASSDVPDPADADDASLPLVLWTPHSAYVVVPAGNRTFRVERPAAELVELLLVLGSVEAASAVTDRDRLTYVARFLTEAGVRLPALGDLVRG